MPPGGDGMYFVSTFLLVYYAEYGRFDMRANDDVICTAVGDHDNDGGLNDHSQAACTAMVAVTAGNLSFKTVQDITPYFSFLLRLLTL